MNNKHGLRVIGGATIREARPARRRFWETVRYHRRRLGYDAFDDDLAIGRVRGPEPVYEVHDVIADTFVELIREARSPFAYKAASRRLTSVPANSVNTRRDIPSVFQLKGVRRIGTVPAGFVSRVFILLASIRNAVPLRTGIYTTA